MDLRGDDRGQSVQVGAVLLFAVLVILLATYQSTVVPNDNKAAEFEHSLDAQQDLLDVRNAIIESYQNGEAAPVSVQLGMTYPRHTFGVDPAPVGGSLYNTGGGTISVQRGNGNQVDACPASPETKQLRYAADYNYLSPRPTLVYENTVLYADYDGSQVLVSDQTLVSGSTVNLIALQGNYSDNGVGVTDFAPTAGQYRTTPVQDPIVEVPTTLPEAKWEQLLADEVSNPDAVTVTGTGDARVLTLDLTGQYRVRCALVGSEGTPTGGDRQDEAGPDINPAGPGDIIAENMRESDPTLADFKNTADRTANITSARIAFYYGETATANSVTLTDELTGETYGPFVPGDSLQSLDPSITIPANGDRTLSFQPNKGGNSKGDFFVLQLEFESGQRGTYFISVPSGGSNSGKGTN